MTGLQALGDSFTCGDGVGVQVPLTATWAALLADGLGLRHRSLAVAGARVRDVVQVQLPQATEAEVSTLLVGLNDVARGGFDIEAVRDGLSVSVDRLHELSDHVVLGRLHDPSQVLWMPLPLRRLVRRRQQQVNALVDEVSGVTVVDLAAVPELQVPAGWAVDRVHPSAGGHRALARAAAAALGRDILDAVELPKPPSLTQRAVWSARHGAPYLAGQVIGRWT